MELKVKVQHKCRCCKHYIQMGVEHMCCSDHRVTNKQGYDYGEIMGDIEKMECRYFVPVDIYDGVELTKENYTVIKQMF